MLLSDGRIIALFNDDVPLTGNITNLISLWDAGTEVNHAPGSGEDGADEQEVISSVRNIDNVMDGFNYNNVETNIEVSLAYDGTSEFTLTVSDLVGSVHRCHLLPGWYITMVRSLFLLKANWIMVMDWKISPNRQPRPPED